MHQAMALTQADTLQLQKELNEVKNELTHLVNLAASEDVDAVHYAQALADKYGIDLE